MPQSRTAIAHCQGQRADGRGGEPYNASKHFYASADLHLSPRLRSIAQRPRSATNSTRKKEAGERLNHSRLEVHAFINVGFSPPALVKVRKVVFSGADSRGRTDLTSPNHPSF